MWNLSERHFHLLMGGLIFVSSVADGLPGWQAPQVSLVTLVLGLVWVALFAGYRGRNLEQQVTVLTDRLERNERLAKALDAELAERRL